MSSKISNNLTSKSPAKEEKKSDPVKSNQVLMVKGSRNIRLSPVKLSRDNGVLEQCKLVSNLMSMVEHKEAIPAFRGRDFPTQLTIPHSGYQLIDTKESSLLRSSLARMFQDKEYGFRLATVVNMSSSGTGYVNSTLATSVVSSIGEFSSLSSVFSEFFVTEMRAHWQPVSMYGFPSGYVSGTTTTGLSTMPIGVIAAQHTQAAYTTMALSADSYTYRHHNTGVPFTFTWHNPESKSSTVLPVQTAVATQAWCPVGNASNYSGFIQMISQGSGVTLPFTTLLGQFLVEYHVWFRVRS